MALVAFAGSSAAAAYACCEPATAGERCAFDYTMRLGGATVARLRLAFGRAEDGVLRGELSIRPASFGSWLGDGNRATMEADVALVDGRPRPLRFHVRYDKPDRYRDIRVWFDSLTGEILELRYDNNGRLRDSEVPPSLRTGTVDPVTAFFLLQGWVADPSRRAGERVTVPVFEGRKRLDVLVEYVGTDPADERMLRLRARLIGRFGFDGGYGFVERPGRDAEPVWLDVEARAGRCPVPLRVRGSAGLLEPSIVLEGRVRRPRRRRFPSRAAAPAARRSRTSRGRCRTRRSALPSRRAGERSASSNTP